MTNKPKYYRNSITTETGLSDFHKMTTTVLKTYVKKRSRELIVYRKYKSNDNLLLQEEFPSKFKDLLPNDKSLKGVQDSCLQILDSLAPLKTKYLRANETPFMRCKKLS